MSDFHVGDWVAFYNTRSYQPKRPVSVYRVVKIDNDKVYLSGGGCHNLDGSSLLHNGERFIEPISVEKALEYVKQGCYICEEDNNILEAGRI